jgi:hypothetical protein
LEETVRRPTTKAYVYTIEVDGTLRYIGKGRGGRMLIHAIDAKRSAARCGKDTAHLFPRMHRKLVEAVRVGSDIVERVIISDLPDAAAYRVEGKLIAVFHRLHPGLLWNTIDERFMDQSFLPENWDDPEHPLYRLPRPLPSRFEVAADSNGKSWIAARRPRRPAPRRVVTSHRE